MSAHHMSKRASDNIALIVSNYHKTWKVGSSDASIDASDIDRRLFSRCVSFLSTDSLPT